MSKKYNKVNKKLLSTVLITVLSTGLVVGVVGGVTNGFEDWNLKNWKNNLISEDKIDNTRVALTMPGTYKEQDTYLYVYMDHPKLEDTYELYEWPGISLRNKYKTEGFEYISFDDNNLYILQLIFVNVQNLLSFQHQKNISIDFSILSKNKMKFQYLSIVPFFGLSFQSIQQKLYFLEFDNIFHQEK